MIKGEIDVRRWLEFFDLTSLLPHRRIDIFSRLPAVAVKAELSRSDYFCFNETYIRKGH